MKVLYIHQHFSTPKGSGSVRSYQFAQNLILRGHEVTLVCGSNKKADVGLTGTYRSGIRRGKVDGIDVIEIHIPYSNHDGFLKRIWKFFRFSLAASKVALLEKYDLIFSSSTPLSVALPGILARWLKRKPFLFEVRDLWPELPAAMGVIKNPLILGLLKQFEKLAYRSANHCIALSPGMCEGIQRSGISIKKVTMIPNGCDLDLLPQAYMSNECEVQWRESFSSDNFVAIFAGAHGLANGLDAVLDVARVLLDRGETNIKFLLVGDGKFKKALQHRAAEQKLDNCVFWEPVPKLIMFGLLQKADVGLMLLRNIPAFYNGTSPNKFFDYIMSGLPVINNYPGWVADLIKEYHCGLAISPDNPNEFAEALLSLKAMPKTAYLEMANNAKNLAKAKFDREMLADRFFNLCEELYDASK